jgi:glycine betaine/choline ABC-type transport system substrate-binding protein
LNDDKQFFPAYQAGIVIRNETLQQYPELKGLLKRLGNTISDSIMLQLNYAVEIEKKSPNEVAANFLKQHKLLK